jgi:hypothetical protein
MLDIRNEIILRCRPAGWQAVARRWQHAKNFASAARRQRDKNKNKKVALTLLDNSFTVRTMCDLLNDKPLTNSLEGGD